MYKHVIKRLIDLILSSIGIVILALIHNARRQLHPQDNLDELPQIYQVFTSQLSAMGERGIIEATKKNMGFSRVAAVNSDSL